MDSKYTGYTDFARTFSCELMCVCYFKVKEKKLAGAEQKPILQ